MDGESRSSLWSKLSHLFAGKTEDHLEQAIIKARKYGELDLEEGNMLLSILKLSDMQVHDIMTPRTDIDCLSSGISMIDAAHSIMETGHSRLPIFNDTRDNIIGIVYAKDLLPALIGKDSTSKNTPVDTIMRTPYFIPETKISTDLLQEFRARKNHIAIVVDEYGGTSGLVTIEDLLEVIVGEIEDEHDAPKEIEIQKISDDEYLANGRAYLEDLEELGIILQSDEVETLGGFLSLEAGKVPQNDESFTFNSWDFTVVNADAKQIHKVTIKKHQPTMD